MPEALNSAIEQHAGAVPHPHTAPGSLPASPVHGTTSHVQDCRRYSPALLPPLPQLPLHLLLPASLVKALAAAMLAATSSASTTAALLSPCYSPSCPQALLSACAYMLPSLLASAALELRWRRQFMESKAGIRPASQHRPVGRVGNCQQCATSQEPAAAVCAAPPAPQQAAPQLPASAPAPGGQQQRPDMRRLLATAARTALLQRQQQPESCAAGSSHCAQPPSHTPAGSRSPQASVESARPRMDTALGPSMRRSMTVSVKVRGWAGVCVAQHLMVTRKAHLPTSHCLMHGVACVMPEATPRCAPGDCLLLPGLPAAAPKRSYNLPALRLARKQH